MTCTKGREAHEAGMLKEALDLSHLGLVSRAGGAGSTE